MKTFEVIFRKNGVEYKTLWEALAETHCIEDIENMFTFLLSFEANLNQNNVISVTEIKEERQ
jgi:hypothetical protein